MYFIKKEALSSFIDSLISKYPVIAPVKQENLHKFEQIKSFWNMDLEFVNTLYPPKKYFLGQEDIIYTFHGSKLKVNFDDSKKVMFGIRPCDVNGLLVLDKIFAIDPHYKARRDNTILIALHCKQSGHNCFCVPQNTHHLKSGFDLYFFEADNGYIVDVGTDIGKNLLTTDFEETDQEPNTEFECNTTIKTEDIQNLESQYDNPLWDDYSKDCLSCSACTMTCPTCGCFTYSDECNLDLVSGKKYKKESSCQGKGFTRVSGGFSFRADLKKRVRHRIMHKFVYFKKQHDEYMCVGCGRCITNCPTGMDMRKIIGELNDG